ncbi:hypothetical protein, partial [Campylobacter coli]|uniref:hypothetical protein n=1 Tax=Campylobacter coli TaxID=195 RepID=UPI001C9315B3
MFLRTSHAFTIFMLSFALFSAIANAVFLSYYIEEENYYIYLVSSFFLINGFLLTIIFIGEKKYVKEVYYDDNFIS